MSAELTRRVQEAMEALDYHPDHIAPADRMETPANPLVVLKAELRIRESTTPPPN